MGHLFLIIGFIRSDNDCDIQATEVKDDGGGGLGTSTSPSNICITVFILGLFS